MDAHLLYIISAIGAATMVGVFIRMKGGFGPMNLRAVGIILIGTFAAILAVSKAESLNASLGILGAIAGYLFGYRGSEKEKEQEVGSSASISGSTMGAGSKVAGRDINETIEHMQADLANIGQVVNHWKTEASAAGIMISAQHRWTWRSEDPEFEGRMSLIDRNDDSWPLLYFSVVTSTREFREALKIELARLRDEGWSPTGIRFGDNISRGILLFIDVTRAYKDA